MRSMNKVDPTTAEEAVAAWDRGDEVQTVEMGGLGAAYEQVIQNVAFDVMRSLLADPEMLAIARGEVDGNEFPPTFLGWMDKQVLQSDAMGAYGMSGAQASAAQHIAIMFVRHGWDGAKEQVPDRLIYVHKQDPMPMLAAEGLDQGGLQ